MNIHVTQTTAECETELQMAAFSENRRRQYADKFQNAVRTALKTIRVRRSRGKIGRPLSVAGYDF